MIQRRGFVFLRRGKGDHNIYQNPTTGETVALDGGPNREMPRGAWLALKKRLRLP